MIDEITSASVIIIAHLTYSFNWADPQLGISEALQTKRAQSPFQEL